eukprot:Phypoly_transcript_00867.p1 GENE.Phypoly_transcript_00867~~Phypoly_transcript_00867.p1  ORF type:complete len:770 (+),score=104.96 Phypoly_transcript_00867:1491-3800(+)
MLFVKLARFSPSCHLCHKKAIAQKHTPTPPPFFVLFKGSSYSYCQSNAHYSMSPNQFADEMKPQLTPTKALPVESILSILKAVPHGVVDNTSLDTILQFLTHSAHSLYVFRKDQSKEHVVTKGLIGVVEVLVKNNDWEKAVVCVEAMSKAHIPVSSNLFNQLLAHQIQCNSLEGAWGLWRTSQGNIKPTTEVLQLLVRKKELQWGLLASTIKASRTPDISVFTRLFKGAVTEGDVEKGKHLLQTMRLAGVEPNTFIYNSMLFLMVKHTPREAQTAFTLFNEMKALGVAPDVATYNAVMSIKRNMSDAEGCFSLFEDMKSRGISPDVYSYNILMDVRGKQRDEVGVTNIINVLLTSNTAPTRASFNILLRVIAERGDISNCQQVLAQIKKQFGSANVFGYNCLLECLAKHRDTVECKALLKEMREVDVQPDATTLNIIVKHFPPQEAELLAMVLHVQKDTHTYNILLSNALAQHDTHTAISLLRAMSREAVRPDAHTYSTVLKAIITLKDIPVGTPVEDLCTTASHLAEFNQAINNMRQEGIMPDVLSYQLLIAEAIESGDIQSCQKLVEEMAQSGVTMDAKFYGTIVNKLAKQGYWKEANTIFTEIQATGVELDTGIYDIMLANTAKNGSFQDCVCLFAQMKGAGLYSARSFSIMIHVAAANKRWADGASFLRDMRAHTFKAEAPVYTALVSGALYCGDLILYHLLLSDIMESNVGDLKLYFTMHNGLQALLAQDKWKHIHPQAIQELQFLESEMQRKVSQFLGQDWPR